MGLFDSYYDPQTYSGGGSGLIDRLLSQLGTQGQYQPAPGFAPNPMDANAAAPNAPIAVGDYQMPRVGSGFQQNTQPMQQPAPQMPVQAQYQPAQMGPLPSDTAQYGQPSGMLPQQYAAQPVSLRVPQVGASQPQQPAQALANTLPAFMQSQGSGGGISGAFRGAMANQQGGLLGLVGGAIAGGLGMGTGSPEEVKRQGMRVQYQALLDAGIPKEKALLATINPEYGKQIVSEALSNKQKFVQLKDGMGAEHPAFVDETAQTVNGQSIGEYNKQQGAATGGALGNMDLTGKDYLASLPPQERNIVQGMAEGTIAPPSSFAMAKPVWTARIAAARNYDPSFDATQWGGRVAGVRDFSAGKSSEMVRSANQTIGHVGDLIGKMDALKNGDYPMKNAAGNWMDTQTGGGATTGFHQTAHAVADELSKVFKGTGISDSEIKQWEESLSPNMSPAQQREAVTTAMSLLNHSLSALEEKRLNSIGPMAAEKAGPLLKPDAQAAVDRINKWAAGGSSSTAAPTVPTGGTAGPKKVSWSVE